jgi:hypothetical protein
MRRIETFDWWPDLVGMKDELSLRELAEKFDVTPGAISAAFKRGGLSRKPAPPGPRARRRGRGDDDTLPPEPGEDLAARPGSKDHRILPHAHLLGSVPDADVAEKAGVSVRTIASFRARNIISGYKGPRRRRTAARTGRGSKVDAFVQLLGKVPDRVVAEQAGVSLNAVRAYRTRMGISAAGRGRPPGHSAIGLGGRGLGVHRDEHGYPGPLQASNGGTGAWKVIAGAGDIRLVRVIVARSAADAAAQAEAAAIGNVLSLEWIGDVL